LEANIASPSGTTDQEVDPLLKLPLPPIFGSCEKIKLTGEISFSRCPGDGKIRAAKIDGTWMIPNGYPAFRKGTPANWNKTM
jgi:hypothetical protein